MHNEIYDIQKKLQDNETLLLNTYNQSLSHANNSKLQKITNFSGSNGQLFINKKFIILFTDARYLLQAKQEVSTQIQITLKNPIVYDTNLQNTKFICNTKLFPIIKISNTQTIKHIETETLPIKRHEKINNNCIYKDAFKDNILYYKYGDSVNSKITTLRQIMIKKEIAKYVIANYEQASWLLNIRGTQENSDVMSCPIYIIITLETIILYTNTKLHIIKISETLNSKNCIIKPEKDFYRDIHNINSPILLSNCNHYTYSILKKYAENYQDNINLIHSLKRKKNQQEINTFKKIHIQDSITLIEFYQWIENQYTKNTDLTENDVSKKLEELRNNNPLYIQQSFTSIVGNNSNSAIIHYNPSKNPSTISNGPLLIDAGGHYYGGTTDVTRTIYLSNKQDKIPEQVKYIYTIVLKAHLSIYNTIFPKLTPLSSISSIVNNCMLSHNFHPLNSTLTPLSLQLYCPHSIGHGIGNCLNVHESQYNNLNFAYPLEEDLIFTNEPGLYFNNLFGIRLENAMLSKIYEKNPKYITLENLTLVPFCKKLINPDLLSPQDKQNIQKYYNDINNIIMPLISNTKTKKWLTNELNISF